MKNSKRVIAFLMAMTVIGMNLPMNLTGAKCITAFAEEAQGSVSVVKQPKDESKMLGHSAVFSVEVNGNVLSYQWQYSKDNGETWLNWNTSSRPTAAESTFEMQTAEKYNGWLMRCQVIASNGDIVYSETARLSIVSLEITSHPSNALGKIGNTVEFSVDVDSTSNVTYQWQYSKDNGETWLNWKTDSRPTAAESTFEMQVAEKYNGWLMRCQVTALNGDKVYSETARLSIASLEIKSQPSNALGKIGDTVEFSVDVDSTSNVTYQWQYSKDNGETWLNWNTSSRPTAAESTFEMQVAEKYNGWLMRCQVIASNGDIVYSETASLSIVSLEITSHPSNALGKIGDTVEFSVDVDSTSSVTYQWQYSKDNGETWLNWNTSSRPTAAESTFEMQAAEKYNGWLMRCQVTASNGDIVYSETARLSIVSLEITLQPSDTLGIIGDTVEFSVNVDSASNVTYQWQYSKDNGETWLNWNTSSRPTAAESTFEMQVAEKYNGWLMRCQITNANGETFYSAPATLTIAAPLTLTNPSDITISSDSTATFTVTATGTGDLTYLWESSVDGNTWTTIPNSNSATLSVDGTNAVSGTQYRCTVSDAYGQSKTSDPATLTLLSNECGDNLTYTYNAGTLTISGEGEMWSYTDAESSPFYELDIDTLIIEDGVTVIGAHAFEDNNIQTVVLPESVFSVRYKAFWGNDNIDITVENIGCAIYDKALPDTATVRGYMNSSAYHSAQGENQTFIDLGEESDFEAHSNKIVLSVGDTYQIDAVGEGLRYYSFDDDVVTVDDNGLVTAVADNEDDRDAKVMVYDKAGRTAVFYFAVINENTSDWRYTIICPSSEETSPFVPFWGERVSLNEDIAEIVEWDHAQVTGQFGTAPIISADDRGNAYIFYLTYDADIRPIKANELYTEETFKITEDWQHAFYHPYYSYTAEEDTRVYFKAYGSEDLNVTVYGEFGADPITDDWDGGRAEVSFDVKAGETVYIQPTSCNNQAFTYTMQLSTSAIETVSLTDNEVYSITPETCGDLTTLAFTAPEDGNYLIEGRSDTPFGYELANNTDFTDTEYDEYGFQIENSSRWFDSTRTEDTILPYYVWLNKDETVYIHGYFEDETDSDDTISFRVHAVTVADTELAVNTLEAPNYISYDPDDFDRRTLTATAGTEYRFVMDAVDLEFVKLVVWDEDWNSVSMDYNDAGDVRIWWMYCDHDQIYHVMFLPIYASDEYGRANLTVSTTQDVEVTEGTEYRAFNTNKIPVTYHFTAPEDGWYSFSSRYVEGYRDPMIAYQEVELGECEAYFWDENGDSSFDVYWYDVENAERDTLFYLAAGQTVSFELEIAWLISTDSIYFSLIHTEPAVLTLNEVETNEIGADTFVWYSFTAPEDGTYFFSAQSDEGEMYCIFAGEDGIWSDSQGESASIVRNLSEGENAYVRICSSEDDGLIYRVSVKNVETLITYSELALDTSTAGHFENSAEFDAFSFTAPQAGTYYFYSDSSSDMMGYLYSDEELTDCLVYDDDGFTGYQFLIVVSLTANQTVYLKPVYWSESQSADYTVTVSTVEPEFYGDPEGGESEPDYCPECGGENGNHFPECSYNEGICPDCGCPNGEHTSDCPSGSGHE